MIFSQQAAQSSSSSRNSNNAIYTRRQLRFGYVSYFYLFLCFSRIGRAVCFAQFFLFLILYYSFFPLYTLYPTISRVHIPSLYSTHMILQRKTTQQGLARRCFYLFFFSPSRGYTSRDFLLAVHQPASQRNVMFFVFISQAT